jgi:hypothetical protein
MSAPAPTSINGSIAAASSNAMAQFSNTAISAHTNCPLNSLVDCAFEYIADVNIYVFSGKLPKKTLKNLSLQEGRNIPRANFPKWNDKQKCEFMKNCDGEQIKNGKPRAELKEHLLANATLRVTTEVAYFDLMQSPILSMCPRKKADDSLEAIRHLSEENLQRMEKELAALRQKYEDEDIDDAEKTISEMYENGFCAHATKYGLLPILHSTKNIFDITEFANDYGTGDKPKAQSSTKEVNSAQFHSHHFVFFNVYPSFESNEKRKTALKKCRFLKNDYFEPEKSGMAEGAHTFIYPISGLCSNSVIVMRDPVYPVGIDDETAKTRVKAPFAFQGMNYGSFRYTLNEGTIQTYKTCENIFYGKNIIRALIANVIVGLYRVKASMLSKPAAPSDSGSASVAAPNSASASTATPARSSEAAAVADEFPGWAEVRRNLKNDVSEVIKYFQYPQLLYPGSLSTSNAQIIRWGDGISSDETDEKK